ncbi:probable LRR receptor-like serine/threonine-protein kinase At1g06840 [Dioscorea cayenensis subsp. rotundata]|uniref:non-specific serine/threonine protein kinase n=1 Tax=Dioscorea cayennensis subsp. rotundata TaxID=55577 RepID=A0AB40CBH5_DIOCR|nr:probable LRR receptor-like serine/threonine-protein kinase At1g06840 [Dioscorea cayenensis subsp. rotundata]XP_039136108.1 probable LRR receptor-like serine/threonine-protein kinase At1g06840 [Dioscorea cayenensis subsp. rotundata]XP_039136109.1 probable LRR receptor-like serine/threonine-protein kinase At1g06840 [Dioscorea cayenensis subsp. rotundata]
MTRAKSFLAEVIFTILLCHFSQTVIAEVTAPSEVDALGAIKSRLIDPKGNLNNWNSGDPCTSNWTGVLCYNTTSSDGYLHIQELQLLRMNLSGNLAPELGRLSKLKILDFMWNKITGSIPKEIGSITTLKLLLLNGNQLNGSLPDELGNLPNLDRIQIDQNHISGQLPKSFANLNKTKHFHMNNNSISGQIPPELSRLPSLVHFLLDNNNLSGHIPAEFSKLPKLLILQLDNNNFSGTQIPDSFGSMSTLLKLSLRNCSLQGPIPDLSRVPRLGYLDLSSNQLTGTIPSNKLSDNITTIDLSNNLLSGPIPSNFSGLPNLQRLSLDHNQLNGSVPSTIWRNMIFSANKSLILDFQNNNLTNISNTLNPPANVSIWLYGNPVCSNASLLNISQFCNPETNNQTAGSSSNVTPSCQPCPTDEDYEYNPLSPLSCFCSLPLHVGYRLKSPGFSDFNPYVQDFEEYLSSGLELLLYQLYIDTFSWEEGPRLGMNLKLFPSNGSRFNSSEVLRIRGMFTGWLIGDSDLYGPYELINFTLGSYASVIPSRPKSGLGAGAVVGIVLGAVAVAITLSVIITMVIMKRFSTYSVATRKRSVSRIPIKIEGVKSFTFQEMSQATDNFSNAAQVGQGGYGKVYKGILADGTVVAIKRAQEGSLQGSKEFFTEIELLSRLHHRNLVSLLGYCDEEDEQMLVYEFMPNLTLRDHLSSKSKNGPLSFSLRLRIALGSSRGILYLHTEADPPIFHRDIKASNILLDAKFIAKVADFGLSRLAPLPEGEGTVPGYVSTVVKGTPGYLDPEYFLTHKLTDKSDVYSLGVVFLELLTGMQPISHGKNIVREIMVAYQSGMVFSVIDNRMGSYPSECIEKFVALALRCCQDETERRPAMSEVVRELESIWRMTPESDSVPSESMVTDSVKKSTPTSTSMETNTYISTTDVSGSDLLSGAMPTITPR